MEDSQFTNKLMNEIAVVNEESGSPMTVSAKTTAVQTIGATLNYLKENNIEVNWVNWQKSNFKMNVFAYALLGLSKNDNDYYIIARKDGGMKQGKDGQMYQPYILSLDLQYQGEEKIIIKFCRNSNGARVTSILKNVVCAGEKFETAFDFATGKTVIKDHQITDILGRDKSEKSVRGAYAIAYFDDGSSITTVIDRVRIERAKKAARTKNVWTSDYDKMVLKTAIHDLYKECAKYLTKDEAVNKAVEAIERDKAEEPSHESPLDAVDATFEEKEEAPLPQIDENTGEVLKAKPQEDPKKQPAQAKSWMDI